ncbi:MAG: ABC transporter, partial [Bacteroidota bacterium]
MKELSALNKYFFKYKYYLLLGTIFIIISNIFSIVPAWTVRQAFDLLEQSYGIFQLFDGFSLQEETYSIFALSILICGVVILISALLRGIFMFFMRQTI